MATSHPNRADIACFVGFVRQRSPFAFGENRWLPSPIEQWLTDHGWLTAAVPRNGAAPSGERDLCNLPVPIDSWALFDRIFDWRHRPVKRKFTLEFNAGINLAAGHVRGALRQDFRSHGVMVSPAARLVVDEVGSRWTLIDGNVQYLLHRPEARQATVDVYSCEAAAYLGAAVRSFFAQGGRKCYVVRVGDPWPLREEHGEQPTAEDRSPRLGQMETRLARLIPGYPNQSSLSPTDSHEQWSGVGCLFGLPDVSFLSLPDLADICRADPTDLSAEYQGPHRPEQFAECSVAVEATAQDQTVARLSAPHCDAEGYEQWARTLNAVARLLARHLREVQLVATVPIPLGDGPSSIDLRAALSSPLGKTIDDPSHTGIASAFVQLTYPWLRTPGSAFLPEQLESPDGALAGLLARNALVRGAFFSAAGQPIADAAGRHPPLSQALMTTPLTASMRHTLLERVSLCGATPDGLQLLSDVTTSLDERYRPANVNRLVSAIVRAARRQGEENLFETSNEVLWNRIRTRITYLLTGFWQNGALRGAARADAFGVRCDRSTMSQHDIENGRVVAEVWFYAATAIEQITVRLAMDPA